MALLSAAVCWHPATADADAAVDVGDGDVGDATAAADSAAADAAEWEATAARALI